MHGTTIDRGRFLRRNVNDLDALLRFVVDGPFVVISVFNAAYRRFTVNWAYSVRRFGRVRGNMLLATHDDESLVQCLNLGLACYNGTNLLQAEDAVQLTSRDVSHGNKDYYKLTWTKPIFIKVKSRGTFVSVVGFFLYPFQIVAEI